MTAVRHLRAVDDNGELIETTSVEEQNRALQASLARAERVIQGLKNDKTRRRREYERREEVQAVLDEWKTKLGKGKSRLTDDRFDAIQNLFEKGYTREDFSLMLDGLREFRYVVYGKRCQTGSQASERVDIEYVCAKGARFEELANLGHYVRKAAAS